MTKEEEKIQLKEARAKLKELTGKNTFNGWNYTTLLEKIGEAEQIVENAVPIFKAIIEIVKEIFEIHLVEKKKGQKIGLFLRNGRAIYTKEYVTAKQHEQVMNALLELDYHKAIDTGHIRKKGAIRRFIKQAVEAHN